MTFDIENSGSNLWKTWSKLEYSNRMIQASTELIDNAISALISQLTKKTFVGKILFNIDTETGTASIEDNGPGFSTDPIDLGRCWSYGASKPGGLNEHGCGAKTALSIFDVEGRGWMVYWKKDTDPNIFMIRGPLEKTMVIHKVEKWPGKLVDSSSGVYMTFPCSVECFRSLFGNNVKTDTVKKDGIKRFKRELSQMYLFQEQIALKQIIMEVNGDVIEPFVLDYNSDSVISHEKTEFTLGPDGKNKVILTCIHLKEECKDSWFKVNSTRMGIYTWKNGRFIAHVNTGELFERITHKKPHPSMAGKIILVSMIGDQSTLPPTDPTKTNWSSNKTAFQEFVTKLSKTASPFFSSGVPKEYERDFVKIFVDERRKNLEPIMPGYTCSVNETINNETPPIDVIEMLSDNQVYIYEAKKSNQASIKDVSQLYTNYILARKAYEHANVEITKAILILNCDSDSSPIDEKLEAQVKTLMEFGMFPFEIHSYKHGCVWPKIARHTLKRVSK